MHILGIETSCDDTGVAIVSNGKKILSNLISSQHRFHEKYSGVVPEIAARQHIEALQPLLEEALNQAKLKIEEIDCLAVTTHPGLIGSLMVGVNCAKTIAYGYQKPLLGVSHLKAHFYSIIMSSKITYPFLGLLVSGGHTLLAVCHSPLDIKLIGTTVDDACGECFDKVAKFFNLGYPGGPMIEKTALKGDESSYQFPNIQFKKKSYNFSFSGLKTAVIHHHEKYLKNKKDSSLNLSNLTASFQKTAFQYLYNQTITVAKTMGIKQIGVCGGVSCNQYLRNLFLSNSKVQTFFPDFSLCTDNAAMIAGLAYHYYQEKEIIEDVLTLSPRAKSFKKEKIL